MKNSRHISESASDLPRPSKPRRKARIPRGQ
nr:MAG TPA: hypothetical protein [Caudoviricetes sp.]